MFLKWTECYKCQKNNILSPLSSLLSELSIYIFFVDTSYRPRTATHEKALKQNVLIILISPDAASTCIFQVQNRQQKTYE